MSDQADPQLARLGALMREEWDRRIEHDYRYWMSDGVADDAEMWNVGERDFKLLLDGALGAPFGNKTALEIGCGVGRLLRAASHHFGRVIGFDVSEQGIREARRLLADRPNVEAIVGDGASLYPIPAKSVDFVFSFAALCSMPVRVFVSYLLEVRRILSEGGEAKLQIYLGSLQQTTEEDTLAIRCFERGAFASAIIMAGFELRSVQKLVLPFEASDPALGMSAEVAHLTIRQDAAIDLLLSQPSLSSRDALIDSISAVLHPAGEARAGTRWSGSRTEYLMAIARAEQHMNAGRIPEAGQALAFAVKHYAEADDDIKKLLNEIQSVVQWNAAELPVAEAPKGAEPLVTLNSVSQTLGSEFSSDYFQKNMSCLRERFPQVASQLQGRSGGEAITVRRTGLGEPVLEVRKLALSHHERPARSAESWADRVVNSLRLSASTQLVLIGFADGYGVDALLAKVSNLHVIEPRPEVMQAAIAIRDCTAALGRLRSLHVGVEQVQSLLDITGTDQLEIVIHPQTQAISGTLVDEIKRRIQSERGWGMLRPNIGVVGPMYGGSLPIAGYTADALHSLEQRVSSIDFSRFYDSFKHARSFLRSEERKSTIDSQYVELMSQIVLEAINERAIDVLICLAQAPVSPRLLKECRSRGITTVLWFVEDCRRFTTWQQVAPFYDYIFLIQGDEFPGMVEKAGAGRAMYLPVGCDPRIHRPVTLSEEEQRRFGSRVSFVGAGYNNRRHVFSQFTKYDFKIWGTEWPAMFPFTKLVQDGGSRVSVEDYVKVFSASEINVNLHSSAERDGVEPYGDFVNPRTFELAACGAFQLVDTRKYLAENFVPGKEIATFSDEKELHEKIQYYLHNPAARIPLMEAARARALAEHTYEHRLKHMLDCIYADRYEQIRAKVLSGPWPRTLEGAQRFPELTDRLKTAYDRGDEPVLDALVQDIRTGKGTLTETEQKLLFLHHIRNQISYVQKLRKE